jgi:hypothetical protein
VTLQGYVTYSGPSPVVQWKLYSGPGSVTFANAAQTNSTVTFGSPGVYTLMLSAADGIHAVAYDAVVITVSSGVRLNISTTGAGMNPMLTWTGGSPPYVLQRTGRLNPAMWVSILTTNGLALSISPTGSAGYYRVQSQ